LPVEKITMAGGELQPYKASDAEWSREMRNRKMLMAMPLKNWVFIWQKRDAATGQSLQQALMRVCPGLGMQVSPAKVVELDNDRTETFVAGLKANCDKTTQMVICLLPNNAKVRYDAIKKLCCVEQPIPSQCVMTKTLMKQQMIMSVAGKIGMQLNCKLGGELWAVEVPLKGLMVVGYDTYHDSSKKGHSVGGFISSMNKNLTRYYSKITRQATHQELSSQIKTCMMGSLKQWMDQNGALPDRIIYYRDGVGDGQLHALEENEIKQIREAMRSVGGDEYVERVKWCFIVVTKRINIRMFTRPPGGAAELANPPPGTIADVQVTRPERYDFYLVSQSVRQGTVTPASFNVIWDNSGLKPDHIQRLSYKLTHLYFNWPGTIRVPAPCQYAHKLAFLIGQNVHRDPHPDLAHNLFYL